MVVEESTPESKVVLSVNFYELRKGIKIKSTIPDTKFDSFTFKNFFPILLRTFKNFDFTLHKNAFKYILIFLEMRVKVTALFKSNH